MREFEGRALKRFCGVVGQSPTVFFPYSTFTVQPKLSSFKPHWMPVSSS